MNKIESERESMMQDKLVSSLHLLHSSGVVHKGCILRHSGGQSGGQVGALVLWLPPESRALQAFIEALWHQFCLLWRLQLVSQECEVTKTVSTPSLMGAVIGY